jgi:phosphonate transport system substrate-binding protein
MIFNGRRMTPIPEILVAARKRWDDMPFALHYGISVNFIDKTGEDMLLGKRLLLAAVAAMLIGPVFARDAVLAVNEGSTYQEPDSAPFQERYTPLADLLSRELKRPVKVVQVDKYDRLEKGLAEESYDMAFIHPAHIALRAVKAAAYQGICTAKGYTDYRARVLVPKDSTLKSMADLRGKKLGVPSIDSITTVMFLATLRQMRLPQPEKQLTATRYQDAVPFMVTQGFVDAGVTGSDAVAKAWTGKGGRILGETRGIAIKQFLVSRQLAEADRNRVRTMMLDLANHEEGRAALTKIGMSGFAPWDAGAMSEATAGLGL